MIKLSTIEDKVWTVICVGCFLYGLLSAGDWARLYGEPKRASITALRLGLNVLDDTYAGREA